MMFGLAALLAGGARAEVPKVEETVYMDADKTLIWNFEKEYSVKLIATNGVIRGLDENVKEDSVYWYTHGDEITVYADPDEHYQFVRWDDNSTSTSRTETVEGILDLVAHFDLKMYDLTVEASHPWFVDDIIGNPTPGTGQYQALTNVVQSIDKFIYESGDNPRRRLRVIGADVE